MKRKGTCWTAGDVASMLALPVLAVVPVMLTGWERHRRRRRRLTLVLAVATAVVTCGVAVAWLFLS